jgi:hypothetical protein
MLTGQRFVEVNELHEMEAEVRMDALGLAAAM